MLEGKAAFITGGGTGVGRALALQLAERGCSVAVNYSRSKDAAEETVAALLAKGVKAIALQGDVANDEDCRAMIDTATKEFGRLDSLCNNAGTTMFVDHKDLEAVDLDEWDRVFAVNVRGAFQMSRAARPALAASGAGTIVNTSSVAGTHGRGSSVPYCASKAALNNLTLTLARALAPEIRVNAVAPGFISSGWFDKAFGESVTALQEHFANEAPLGKVCSPDDVATAILGFINGSALITGQVLVIDGGMTISAA
jgi:3-oxoacyl-[acyl-carrier protein] reductase